jgi:hypothetical protein
MIFLIGRRNTRGPQRFQRPMIHSDYEKQVVRAGHHGQEGETGG